VPLSALGFRARATVSGVLMISFNASEYHGNPFLYIEAAGDRARFRECADRHAAGGLEAIGERELAPSEQRQLAVPPARVARVLADCGRDGADDRLLVTCTR
jgi:hypothetical protein